MIKIIFTVLSFLLISLQSKFIFGGDSAEFTTALSSFSIPHPPGYPLYTLIGNIVVKLIPINSIAWRTSLLSSIPTVITAYFIYIILLKLFRKPFFALIASLFYAFLFPIWLYAEVTEVFALNNMFIIMITYLIICFNESNKNKFKYLIWLFIGLSIAHHYTFVLFIPGWYFLVNKNLRPKLILEKWYKNLIFLSMGLIFYLYAPIASYFNPPIDWENAKTLAGFIRLITRSSYGVFSAYADSHPLITNQIFDFFSLFIFLLHDFKILGIIFIIAGLYYSFRKNLSIRYFLLSNLILSFAFIFYSNFKLNSALIAGIFERFLTFVYLNLIFYFTLGIFLFNDLIQYVVKKYINNQTLKIIAFNSFNIFLIFFIILSFLNNYPKISNIKSSQYFENYANDLLNTIPSNSILFLSGDTANFVTGYELFVNKKRPDIKFIYITLLSRDYYQDKIKKMYPDLIIPKYTTSSNQYFDNLLKLNSNKFSIYFENPVSIGFWQPYGLVWKYYRTPEEAKKDSINLSLINKQLWQSYHIPKLTLYQKNILILSNLGDIYGRAIADYADLFINIKEYISAKYILDNSDLVDQNIKLILNSKLYIQTKECKKAKFYIDKIISNNRFNVTLIETTLILKYFGLCDAENTKIPQYFDIYRDLKKTNSTNDPTNANRRYEF